MIPINPRSAGMKYSTIGLELALSIILGWYVGRRLDQKFDTAPYLEITGFFLGLIAGFRSLFRAAKQMQIEADKETEEEAAANAALRGSDPTTESGPSESALDTAPASQDDEFLPASQDERDDD